MLLRFYMFDTIISIFLFRDKNLYSPNIDFSSISATLYLQEAKASPCCQTIDYLEKQEESVPMIKIEYCGYHTHNPDRELIYRPSGTASYLFLLVLSRPFPVRVFSMSRGLTSTIRLKSVFSTAMSISSVIRQLWNNIIFRRMSCFIRIIQKKSTGF